MSADNQQETLENYYYIGFCAGEMYCGLMKLANKKCKSGYYYTPDLTIANSDRNILIKINDVLCLGAGIISPIKGGYNLKIRGWKKVKKALSFFKKFPPLKKSILFHKITLLNKAYKVFEAKGRTKRSATDTSNFEKIISQFKAMKNDSSLHEQIKKELISQDALGHYFSGLFDAEGSLGLKKRDMTYQPFLALGMRDQYLVRKFREFVVAGNVYYRSHQNIYFYETGDRNSVNRIIKLFTGTYPLRLEKNIQRVNKLQRILNDHTHGPVASSIYYDEKLW